MAHEIYEQDNVVLFKQPGWHGLGTIVQEDMSPSDAMRIGGFDWEVSMTPIHNELDGELSLIPDLQAVTRVDTKEVFGVFSKYQPIQNREVFDLAYTLNDEVKVETAGTLFNGRKLFITLRGDSFTIGNGDKVERYLVLANSHDGTLSLSAVPTSIRVVCNNTLNMTLKQGAKRAWNIKHTANAPTKLAEMEKALKRFQETGSLFEDMANELAKKELNKKKLVNFFSDCYEMIYGAPDTEKQELDAEQTFEKWTTTFETERAMFGAEANLWLAANAVTQDILHSDPKRIQDNWQERRMFSNLFGPNTDLCTGVANLAIKI